MSHVPRIPQFHRMNPTPEIKIERRPRPQGNQAIVGRMHTLREAIKRLRGNQSFRWPNHSEPYKASYQLGVKITTRKDNGNGFVVWRVK